MHSVNFIILLLQSWVTCTPRRSLANGMQMKENDMCESQVLASLNIIQIINVYECNGKNIFMT